MSRKKKQNYMTNPANPWIAIDSRGIPEKKDGKQIRAYLTRRRCEDYIRNHGNIRKLIPIRLKELEIAHIIVT